MKKVWIWILAAIVLVLIVVAIVVLSVGGTQDPTVTTGGTEPEPTDGSTAPTVAPAEGDAVYEPHYEFLPGGIGVNLNENITSINYDDLELSQTRWVRGFINYFGADEDISARVASFRKLKEAGYNTIVSIKFNYSSNNLPASQESYDRVLSKLDDFLDRIYPYTDIIVSGNEPFIESLVEERNEIVINFYKEVTLRIHNYVMAQDREVPIFVGAINQIWETTFLNDYHEDDFIRYVRETPWIAGIDLHIHHKTMDEFDYSMEYVSEQLRDDQKIIATEFSLMKYWKSHTSESIPGAFAAKYGYNTSWKVHEYIDYAVKNRAKITRGEWEDFLSSCSWYTDMQDYLLDAYSHFMRNEKFYVATYGMYIFFNSSNTFGPNSDPWLLNPLFATSTVQSDENNRYQPNYKMLANFQQIQQMTNGSEAYILGNVEIPALDVPAGTTLEAVLAELPETVKLPTNKGVVEVSVLKWECEGFNSEAVGRYIFVAAQTSLPDSAKNPDNYGITAVVNVYQEAKPFSIELPDPTGDDLWFQFDEPAGTGLATDSLNGITSTAFTASYVTDSVRGGCVAFQKPGDAIQFGKAEAAGQTYFNSGFTTRTIAFWFNASSIKGKQMLVEIGGSVSGMAVRINDGMLEAAVSSEMVGSVALSGADVNVWKHVVLSFDGGQCNFYVDGVLVASETVSKTQIGNAANPSDIGCNAHGSNAFNDPDKSQDFVGLIDDLRFYNSVVVPVATNAD